MGLQSPSLGEETQPPDNHFRPVSPSLIPELMPSPVATPCASPSLGLIPEAAMRRAAELPVQKEARGGTRMTTAVCKRASRMARPSEPSESAQQLADYLVSQAEADLRDQGFERQLLEELQVFKHQAASTGKGPAVRADTGDANNDAAAQAMMNHVRAAPPHCLSLPLADRYTTTCALFVSDGVDQESPRGHQQPRAAVAHGRTECVSSNVWPAGGQRDQE